MMWNLSFISEEDFTNHVKANIEKTIENLQKQYGFSLFEIIK